MTTAATPDQPPLVALSVDPASRADLVTASVAMTAGGEPLRLALTVPAGPASVAELLPVLRGLSSLFAARGTARVEREGRQVACRSGCGACCRQMVPVAGAEARALAVLVEAMPEPRRSRVRARFDAALAALDAAGLLDRLADPAAISPADQGIAYFRLGIACPFLEDEACSIHPDRPLSCREYLVTSPPDQCAKTEERDIAMVPIAWKLSQSLYRTEGAEGWLPLILALRHAATPAPAARDGRAILAEVFSVERG